MPKESNRRRLGSPLTLGAVVFLAAALLGGCVSTSDITGSINAAQPLPRDETSLRAYADEWGKRFDQNPGEKVASIRYARALRALTRYDEAVAVTRTAATKAPKDFEILGEYGKALADDGQLLQAKDVLTRAYPDERPNWDIMSVQGTIADRLGDHDAAMEFYMNALKIAPDEPTILTNLGLSYALAKQLPDAERTLRQAAANPRADARTRADLALVLSLEGKYGEAEQVSLRDMAPETAQANVQAIRQMIAQTDSWRQLQGPAAKGPKSAAAKATPKPPAAGSGDAG
jgi:Flp pilus assembly protein TadD